MPLEVEVMPQTEKGVMQNYWVDRTNYLPMWVSKSPIPEQIILPYERHEHLILSQRLFNEVPIISAAVMNKACISVGSAWQPQFAGLVNNKQDEEWAAQATNWLKHDFYPNVSWMGQNQTFQDVLALTSKDLDVDGGTLMLFRNTKSGLPRIQLIPVDRIGSRDNSDTVEGGKYDGYKIYDGVIFNNENMPIAINVLGSDKDSDTQISLFNCQYLYEPAWDGAVHGMPKLSYSLSHILDIKDINKLLKITVKNFSAKGIIHKNAKGAIPKGKTGVFSIQRPKPAQQFQVNSEAQNKIFYESILQGGTEYISSIDGSDIVPFNFDRPSPNTEAFLYRLSAEAIASIGWFIELVTPNKLNGTSVRAIQDQARKLIVWRQRVLERRAKAIVQYGLATAMQLGIVPQTNNKTWMRWSFTKPAVLSVDRGDMDNQFQAHLLGLLSKQEFCAQQGKDWVEVSNQVDIETRDLFRRAKALAEEFEISEAEAREYLSKRDIDQIAPQPAKPETPSEPNQEEPIDNDSTEDDGDETNPKDDE